VSVGRQQIQAFSPSLVHYIGHLHLAVAAFLAATGLAMEFLAWFGVRQGQVWAFIGTHTIRDGKLEDFQQSCGELVKVVEANEPRLIAFNIYVNEDGTEATILQVHPDPDSMLFHMQVVREHISEAYQSVLEKTKRIDVYGKPSATVLETIGQLAGSGVPLSVKAHYLGGFTRATAG
jgi:hypothetical protein